MLSQRLSVKSLKEGQVKIFKLIGSGEIDPATEGPRYNSGGTFAGYFTIYDPFEKNPLNRKKVLKNITGSATVIKDGKEVIEEVVSNIEFNRQNICVVKHDEIHKLICLTRANENKSNPFRDKSKPAIWEELEPAETKKDILDKMDLAFKAESYVVSAPITDLQVLAKKLTKEGIENFSPDKKSDELRHDLRILSRRLPKEVLRNSKDKEMKLKIIIDDAVKFYAIDYDDDKKEWVWCDDGATIVACAAGMEPVSALVDHLTKSKEDNTKLLDEVNKLMKSEVES